MPRKPRAREAEAGRRILRAAGTVREVREGILLHIEDNGRLRTRYRGTLPGPEVRPRRSAVDDRQQGRVTAVRTVKPSPSPNDDVTFSMVIEQNLCCGAQSLGWSYWRISRV